MKKSLDRPRLCWTRKELCAAVGLSYRSIQLPEARGLLRRVTVGVNVALYSDESVRELFGAEAATKRAVP